MRSVVALNFRRRNPTQGRTPLWGWLTLCLVLSGCNVAVPSLRNPGHLYTQQLRATYFDPYGNVDAAPQIEGGRPEGYLRPRAAPVQSQWFN